MNITKLIKKYQKNSDIYELVVEAICTTYKKNGVYIDCGAHVGRHTLLMLNNDTCNHVYAIEAIPELCDFINSRINQSKLTLLNAAVSNKTGTLIFSIAENSMGYSGIIQRNDVPVDSWKKITIESVLLDNVLSKDELNKVQLIKLDLEGAEFHALQGSRDILTNSSPLIVFENSLSGAAKEYAYNSETFFNFFNSLNYKIFDFFGNSVDIEYWNNTLQTFMFLAIKNDEELSNKLLFVENIVDDIAKNYD